MFNCYNIISILYLNLNLKNIWLKNFACLFVLKFRKYILYLFFIQINKNRRYLLFFFRYKIINIFIINLDLNAYTNI